MQHMLLALLLLLLALLLLALLLLALLLRLTPSLHKEVTWHKQEAAAIEHECMNVRLQSSGDCNASTGAHHRRKCNCRCELHVHRS